MTQYLNCSVSHNACYAVNQVWPAAYPKEESDKPYKTIGLSLTRNTEIPDYEESLKDFTDSLEKEIFSWSGDTLLGVLPEYCWRVIAQKKNEQNRQSHQVQQPEQVEQLSKIFTYIDTLKTKIRPNLALVLGTAEFYLDGKYTNNAIIIYDGQMWFVPKTKILDKEVDAHIVSGDNHGVIQLPRFNLAVLICADLWENSLALKCAYYQKADVFAVPAWLATMQGTRESARQLWHSLALTISMMHSITVVVADHLNNYAKTDVANATVCFTHSNREKKFPQDYYVTKDVVEIKPTQSRAAKEGWAKKGLAQKPSGMPEQNLILLLENSIKME